MAFLSNSGRAAIGLFAILGVLSGALAGVASEVEAETEPSVVERWLGTHAGVTSLRVDFTQTRRMRSLRVPMRQDGSLWMDHQSGRFRWQAGDPPQTVVIRNGGDLLIVRTPMRRFERRPAGTGTGGNGGMAMLAGAFPRTVEEFEEKYRVLSIERRDNVHRIATKPLGSAGRGVASFTFVVGADDFRLRGMELSLEDGSSVDTVFNRVQPNAVLDPGLFLFDLSGYQETQFRD